MSYLKLNNPEIDRTLHDASGPVFRLVSGFAESVASHSRALAPIETNQLRTKLLPAKVNAGPSDVTFLVGTDPVDHDNGFHYGLVAHEGHAKIETDGLMIFNWKKRGKILIVTSKVAATEGTPFLTDAVQAARAEQPGDVRFVFNDESRRAIHG